MESKSVFEQNLELAGQKAALDAACKRLLANKSILARILKACVEEYQDCSIIEIEEKYIEGEPRIAKVPVHRDTVPDGVCKVVKDDTQSQLQEFVKGIRNEDSTVTEGSVTYDIIFEALNPRVQGQVITMIINVECQNDFYPGYSLVKRGIYYGGRMLSAQYGTVFSDSHYEKLEKVYSIWICVNPPKYRQNTINTYAFEEKQILGNIQENKEYYDLITVCILCLGEEEDKNCQGIIRLLTVLLSDKMRVDEKKSILQEEFEIAMTKRVEREVSAMCNYSEGIERKGIQKGIQETLLLSIKNLMETMNMTAEQAMVALKVDEDTKAKYMEMLLHEKV